MLNNKKKLIVKYEIFLIIFLSLQPLIDVLTTFSLSLNINLTFGVIIRFLVLFGSIIYILYKSLEIGKRYYIYYLLILFSVLLIGTINNFFVKPIFSIGEEGKFIVKIIYLIIMLLAYLLAFTSLKSKLQLENKLIKNILISSLIINIVMVVSIVTSTSLTSYDYSKIGYSGWFYAGNEIGAILAICFPLVLLYSIQSTNSVKDIFKLIPSLLTIFSMLAVGTKVGYAACMVVLLIALFMGLFELLQSKGTSLFKIKRLRSGIISLILFLLILITPFTPIYQNTFAHLNLLGIDLSQDDTSIKDKVVDKSKNEENAVKPPKEEKIKKEQVENLIFSSRELYLEKQKTDFMNAPISQKLFGMGYSGNYTEVPKMIEMDFYDLFFSLGIIGSIILLLPLIIFGIRLIIFALTNFKSIFTLKYSLYIASLMLAFGIAFTAGHVLTAPAVSIYIAAILAFLLVDLQIKDIKYF